MNTNSRSKRNQVKVLEKTESVKKSHIKENLTEQIKVLEGNLTAYTWRDLEANGKFGKNDKIDFITDDMLIVGCDIGSETHYVRAIDTRGRELSKEPYSFNNDQEGFQSLYTWAVNIAAKNKKCQIVLGLEPTGHYWFCLAEWLLSHGITVVQVNPYAVKQSKEIEDNSQAKNDRKDPKTIACLVKDGNYGIPYIPDGVYAEIRRLSTFRDQLLEDQIRCMNRLHRELRIVFPEYNDAFGTLAGISTLELLRVAQTPEDIVALGSEGIKEVWHNKHLRGRIYSRAELIVQYAKDSVGLKNGQKSSRESIVWYVEQIILIKQKLSSIESQLIETCKQIEYVENIMDIGGIGETIMTGIVAEMGDVSRFDDVKEIQKLSGLGLVSCSSGKNQGKTKISCRGRKRLRYWLFQGARSVVAHTDEFKQLHTYYTTRPDNPLKKMQSLIAIACKLLRIIFMLLKSGKKYSAVRMLEDIKRIEAAVA